MLTKLLVLYVTLIDKVYCSPTTGPTAHAGTGILLSPQQSAELVLQNNINSIGNMNNLAAAAANISSLNGQAAMNGIVNSMMQHHNNHTVNAVNHLNNLNASVSSISSAQVNLCNEYYYYLQNFT